MSAVNGFQVAAERFQALIRRWLPGKSIIPTGVTKSPVKNRDSEDGRLLEWFVSETCTNKYVARDWWFVFQMVNGLSLNIAFRESIVNKLRLHSNKLFSYQNRLNQNHNQIPGLKADFLIIDVPNLYTGVWKIWYAPNNNSEVLFQGRKLLCQFVASYLSLICRY